MMRVSFNQPYEKVRDKNGFGYAAKMCKEALTATGHEWGWRWPEADVEINFIQPEHWHWSGPGYRIGYLPWESTKLKDGWVDICNEVDEIWTPSPIVAQWFKDDGITKPIYVYQHGVEPAWSPVVRSRPTTRLQYLHHGAEALRKGGNDTIQAFMATLWDKNAQLCMKMLLEGFNVHDTEHLRIVKKQIPFDELVQLYHDTHVLVYPSWGEGFGFAPLQAMATGMPVLVTKGWAPYEYLLDEKNLIESELVESPWQGHHPGMMFKPDLDDLRVKLTDTYENYEEYAQRAYDLVPKVQNDYNWNTLTSDVFKALEERRK